jgi:hypothetical protein
MTNDTQEIIDWLDSPNADEWRKRKLRRVASPLIAIKEDRASRFPEEPGEEESVFIWYCW